MSTKYQQNECEHFLKTVSLQEILENDSYNFLCQLSMFFTILNRLFDRIWNEYSGVHDALY